MSGRATAHPAAPPGTFRERVRLDELRRAVRHLPPGARVLEIGAGSGWQARALQANGFAVTAVDVATSEYRGAPVFPVQLYDGHRLPFDDGAFDAVFSSNVLEHVPHVAALDREILRVVRPGGVAVHVLPTATWRLWTFVTHYGYAARVLWRLRGGPPSEAEDMFLTRTLAAVHAESLGARCRRALRRVTAGRHGEVGTAVGELYHFSRWRWRAVFGRTGWRLRALHGNSLLYTGYFLFGDGLSLRRRAALSRWLGSSCLIYVLERPAVASRAPRPRP